MTRRRTQSKREKEPLPKTFYNSSPLTRARTWSAYKKNLESGHKHKRPFSALDCFRRFEQVAAASSEWLAPALRTKRSPPTCDSAEPSLAESA